MAYRLLVLNPGSTSTKAAIYEDEHQLAVKSMVHTNQDLAPYPTLYDQLDYRVALVRLWLAQEGFDLSTRWAGAASFPILWRGAIRWTTRWRTACAITPPLTTLPIWED